jgi:hypothetical protein
MEQPLCKPSLGHFPIALSRYRSPGYQRRSAIEKALDLIIEPRRCRISALVGSLQAGPISPPAANRSLLQFLLYKKGGLMLYLHQIVLIQIDSVS